MQAKRLICFSVTAVDDIIGDVRTALNEYNAAALQILADSNEALDLTRERNFSQYSSNITDNTQMTENASVYAEEMLRRVRSSG